MAVHRRQLPIVDHCEAFVPAPGSADEGGFCERCQKQVHDVSAMRESELRRFLAARVGTQVCLSYRTDAHGRLRLRPEPAPMSRESRAVGALAVGALAMLLAACAGHATELEIPGSVCRDVDGYAVSCSEPLAAQMLSVPEVVAAREPAGCPVRPTAPSPEGEPTSEPGPGLEPADAWPDEPPLGEPSPSTGETTPEAPPTAAGARVDFDIDPDGQFLRGVVVVLEAAQVEPDFVPTAELVEQSRERRAERKRARQRERASRRATVSR